MAERRVFACLNQKPFSMRINYNRPHRKSLLHILCIAYGFLSPDGRTKNILRLFFICIYSTSWVSLHLSIFIKSWLKSWNSNHFFSFSLNFFCFSDEPMDLCIYAFVEARKKRKKGVHVFCRLHSFDVTEYVLKALLANINSNLNTKVFPILFELWYNAKTNSVIPFNQTGNLHAKNLHKLQKKKVNSKFK